MPGYGLNRDPERAPLPWNGDANAGFTTGKPWLPLTDDSARCNIEVERADPHSILHLYRRLIALRRAEPALAIGEYRAVGTDGDLLVYTRQYANQRRRVVLNFGSRPQPYRLGESRGQVLLSAHLDRAEEHCNDSLALRGNEGVILALL